MARMISVKKYREMLIANPESLQRALRVLPDFIQHEIDNPSPTGASPRIIKDLQKRLDAAREIAAIRATA
jgi:hypothetical protein